MRLAWGTRSTRRCGGEGGGDGGANDDNDVEEAGSERDGRGELGGDESGGKGGGKISSLRRALKKSSCESAHALLAACIAVRSFAVEAVPASCSATESARRVDERAVAAVSERDGRGELGGDALCAMSQVVRAAAKKTRCGGPRSSVPVRVHTRHLPPASPSGVLPSRRCQRLALRRS